MVPYCDFTEPFEEYAKANLTVRVRYQSVSRALFSGVSDWRTYAGISGESPAISQSVGYFHYHQLWDEHAEIHQRCAEKFVWLNGEWDRHRVCRCTGWQAQILPSKTWPKHHQPDDVETIHNHFKGARNLGRTNNVKVEHGDLVVAILYGEPGQESGHYKRLRDEYNYPLFIGQEFWHRLTGDTNFYAELRQAIAEVAIEARGATLLDKTVQQLAATPEIKKLTGQ